MYFGSIFSDVCLDDNKIWVGYRHFFHVYSHARTTFIFTIHASILQLNHFCNPAVSIFQLQNMMFYLICYGICRRQVLWISKQILQLVMEDAIDEWIIRQINWLRREDIIVQGIRWIQDVRTLSPHFFLHWIYLGSLLSFSLKFDISLDASVALLFFSRTCR